jgi:hypothetical protein
MGQREREKISVFVILLTRELVATTSFWAFVKNIEKLWQSVI